MWPLSKIFEQWKHPYKTRILDKRVDYLKFYILKKYHISYVKKILISFQLIYEAIDKYLRFCKNQMGTQNKPALVSNLKQLLELPIVKDNKSIC